MAIKHKVKKAGAIGEVRVEDGATRGATLGTDLFSSSGAPLAESSVLNSALQPQLDVLSASVAGKAPAYSSTSSSATAGAAAALPATPEGYIDIVVGGQPMKLPYYQP